MAFDKQGRAEGEHARKRAEHDPSHENEKILNIVGGDGGGGDHE